MSSIPNPAFMHGAVPPDPDAAKRFALDSDLAAYGGMGTTGSLGVNLAAPLTRGGFPGEIFTPYPIPTGYWKPAPSPAMLGMAGDTSTGAGSGAGLIPEPSTAGISTPLLAAGAAIAAFYLLR